jgi:hypothetical protein
LGYILGEKEKKKRKEKRKKNNARERKKKERVQIHCTYIDVDTFVLQSAHTCSKENIFFYGKGKSPKAFSTKTICTYLHHVMSCCIILARKA